MRRHVKPIGTPRDAIRPNGFFVEAIVNSATGSKERRAEVPLLRFAHAHEATVIFPCQRPQERPYIRTLIEKPDRVDAYALAVRRAVPIGFEFLPDILAEDFTLFRVLQGALLGQRESLAHVGQTIGEQVNGIQPSGPVAKGGIQCGIHVGAAAWLNVRESLGNAALACLWIIVEPNSV